MQSCRHGILHCSYVFFLSPVNRLTFSWCCVWGSSPSGCASSAYQTESGCSDSSAPYSNSTPVGSRSVLLCWQMSRCIHCVASFLIFSVLCHAEWWLPFVKEERFYLVLKCFYLLEVFLAELFKFFRLLLQELQIALVLLQLLHRLDLNVWGHRETRVMRRITKSH